MIYNIIYSFIPVNQINSHLPFLSVYSSRASSILSLRSLRHSQFFAVDSFLQRLQLQVFLSSNKTTEYYWVLLELDLEIPSPPPAPIRHQHYFPSLSSPARSESCLFLLLLDLSISNSFTRTLLFGHCYS